MRLDTMVRSVDKKKGAKRLRREERIPGTIYGHVGGGEHISASKAQFKAIMALVKQGHLPTTIFVLIDENGNGRRAIVKEIQYHPTSYEVVHLDFEELKEDVLVNVKVPIELLGALDFKGGREGGIPRQVIRHLKVRCPSKDLPSHFELDITDLGIADCMRLSDLTIPSGVKPRADLHEVAVVIVKR
jgi:large subunit ribosomal protein L25